LSKYLSKKGKESQYEDLANDVADSKKKFHIQSMSYANALNDIESRQKFEVMERVVGFMYTQFAFFHQGYELIKELEPCMRELTILLNQKKKEEKLSNQKMPTVELLIQKDEEYNPLRANTTKHVPGRPLYPVTPLLQQKSGYLYKKSTGKMTVGWYRRYFELKEGFLFYHSQSKDDEESNIDLRICMVRESRDTERRFCFELVSPTK
jgi:Arf-GAP/coiled-coil/ANK repeat/PH domain-containing protein